MKYLILLGLLILFFTSPAQINCEAFKYYGDSLKYQACLKTEETEGHYQFSREYQEILDEALAIDSTYDKAYYAKSIAYLKSGDFVTWKKLIDKAVELDPESYLGYRGWCRYQFFRDYEGAIQDIEQLDDLVEYDIGVSKNGTYHLNIAKGLCYKAIGEKDKALDIIEAQIRLNEAENFIGPYDYIHLGVLFLEKSRYQDALEVFEKQSKTNETAENEYYSALAFKALQKNTEYLAAVESAKTLYYAGKKMNDPYSNPLDKIFIAAIEEEHKEALERNANQ